MFSFKMDTSDASSSAMLTVPSQSGQVVAAQESSRIKVEATFDTLSNPARVMKGQLKVLTMLRGRYTPVKDVRSPFDCKRRHLSAFHWYLSSIQQVSQGGFIMLRDGSPDKDHDLVETVVGQFGSKRSFA